MISQKQLSDFARICTFLMSKSNVLGHARVTEHPVGEKTGLNPLFVPSTSVQNVSRSNAVATYARTAPSPRANGWVDATCFKYELLMRAFLKEENWLKFECLLA